MIWNNVFGIFKPTRFEEQAVPIPAGQFEAALAHSEEETFLDQYLEKPEPRVGGAPKESAPGENNQEQE